MSWQSRKGYLFYYKSLRIGGRVRCWYFGSGPAGELAALFDLLRKIERLEEKERVHAELAKERAVDDALKRLCEVASLIARAALLASGFRQHGRSEWRKRRVHRT